MKIDSDVRLQCKLHWAPPGDVLQSRPGDNLSKLADVALCVVVFVGVRLHTAGHTRRAATGLRVTGSLGTPGVGLSDGRRSWII